MAADNPINSSSSSIDPISGFCSETGIYHSLRPAVPLPPLTAPLSVTEYVFQLLDRIIPSSSSPHQALIDSTTRRSIPYPELVRRSNALANFIQQRIGLRRGDVALILSSNSVYVPILYLSLFSCGVIVSPSNPINSKSEISYQIQLCKPAIAFASSDSAFKVPPLPLGTLLLDTLEFDSMMTGETDASSFRPLLKISQSDTAAILYSSGTTGRVKGVELTHRNFISVLDGMYNSRASRNSPAVNMIAVPYFHVYGFVQCLRAVAFGETLVTAGGRFDLRKMVMAIKEFKVTHLATVPAILVALTKKVDDVSSFDMRSLEVVTCGGAPVPGSVIEMFKAQFPSVQVSQGYGLTESTAGVIRAVGAEESGRLGSSGKLMPFFEAKIVDPETGTNNRRGELWLRGPSIMKGYVGDVEATAVALDSDGWLRTGDLCYFDSEGFLYVTDRLKELIKYKGYQASCPCRA
ncbi:4-coumarate--CoA ligase-like 9 isoform X2 [Impatiens glandulifera]|uniref:4-coumarate--CoA ligase-like 9 isoform X2 n=1 Tax=Impatiens glandulifera TaxID=253017 RepID=UPI001FB07179|nr:4-coumarate--CoA ligase-like 9 isoform X2 [Impatiens glandulifera]